MSRRGRRAEGKPNLHGLYPRNFPKTVSGYVDQDYVHTLSPKEKEWLARFNDEHYGACFRGNSEATPEERRESYRRKNSANADLYGIAATRLGELPSTLADTQDERDHAAGPEYLDTPEYREALARYRALLPRNSRTRLDVTPELKEAWANLERAKRRRRT